MPLFDLPKAVKWNPHYAKTTAPPWGKRFDQVITVLGFSHMSPGPEAFADAVYHWQKKQAGLMPDGILGPNSWRRLEVNTRFSINLAKAPPAWLSVAPAAETKAVTAISVPESGSIPMPAGGLAALVRIPVPGTNGLAIEFSPRGFVPKGGSTSTLFIQDVAGNRNLRLDYGYNVKTKAIDYHWNQKGTHANFKIADHTPTGKLGGAGYKAARYFKYLGRAFVVAGATMDVISVVTASKPLKRATEVVSAWGLAWVGCKVVGAGGAATGTFATPGAGTAIGGVAGCIVGGIGGYMGGEKLGAVVFDWAEDTIFTPVPEVAGP